MQYPKKIQILYWKRFVNFSFLLDMENEQTPKYQNFISAQNFPEDPKNTRIKILYHKKYDEHTFDMEVPPEGPKLTTFGKTRSTQRAVLQNAVLQWIFYWENWSSFMSCW